MDPLVQSLITKLACAKDTMPTGMYSDLPKSKVQYQNFVKQMCEELCSERMVDKFFTKLRKSFMFKRQAP